MFEGIDLTQLHWWLVAGAGVVIGAVALAVGQRAFRRPQLEVDEARPASAPKSKDPFTHGSRAEKRRSFRRKGKCVEVELTDQEAQEHPWHAFVLDRSIKGLRLNMDTDMEVGVLYNVRVIGPNPPMPWMEVKALHSKPTGQGYEIGFEFVTAPTWNILLMFG